MRNILFISAMVIAVALAPMVAVAQIPPEARELLDGFAAQQQQQQQQLGMLAMAFWQTVLLLSVSFALWVVVGQNRRLRKMAERLTRAVEGKD